MNAVIEWARTEFPETRLWVNDRMSMTDYAIEKAIKTYRHMAKMEAENRPHYLREAWRLRWLLRLHHTLYRSVGNGKSIPVVPFVSKDSPLQYK